MGLSSFFCLGFFSFFFFLGMMGLVLHLYRTTDEWGHCHVPHSYFIFFVHISSCGSVIFTVLFGTFFEANVLYGCILHVN